MAILIVMAVKLLTLAMMEFVGDGKIIILVLLIIQDAKNCFNKSLTIIK